MRHASFAVLTLALACGTSTDRTPFGATSASTSATSGGAGGAGGATSASSVDAGAGGSLSVTAGAGGAEEPPVECGDTLVATIRDFTPQTHPDFEGNFGMTQGIVKAELGPDGKPVYAHAGPTVGTTGPGPFAQWYVDVPGVNITVPVTLQFTKPSPGKFVYENNDFFPVDNQGFGNYPGYNHNFHFTTEIHSSFTYKGGEVFSFSGDDDVWVFVNKQLAVDLGGLHGPLSATIDFDARAAELGIVPGKTYPLDVFHAERHTVQSNFRIETTIECFVPTPDPQ